jgi:hypothetical protein
MKRYGDIDGDSGILAYDYGDDWVKVQFKGGRTYEYQASKIGPAHISTMKKLADRGDGLNAYIMNNSAVKNGWTSKS